MKMIALMGTVLWASACGGSDSPTDAATVVIKTNGDGGELATCGNSQPPAEGATYNGTTVYPMRCGTPGCAVPICWVCQANPSGVTWTVIGNEACGPDAGP